MANKDPDLFFTLHLHVFREKDVKADRKPKGTVSLQSQHGPNVKRIKFDFVQCFFFPAISDKEQIFQVDQMEGSTKDDHPSDSEEFDDFYD